jgi:hypothetical protein
MAIIKYFLGIIMKRHFILVSLLLVICSNISFSQTFQFTRETIEILIDSNHAAVTGIYHFRNNWNQELTRSLFYPFPISDILFYPDIIQVFNSDNNPLPFKKSSKGIQFNITSQPNSEISVKVKYSQRFLSDEMQYILKSTQSWKHPLLKAEYKILVPLEFELQEISLPITSKDLNSAYNIFYIYKENFMPDNDLIIKWAGRE